MKKEMQENLLAFSNDLNQVINTLDIEQSKYSARIGSIKVEVDLLMQEKDPSEGAISTLILQIEDDINATGLPLKVVMENPYFNALQRSINQQERKSHQSTEDLKIMDIGQVKYNKAMILKRHPWWDTVRVLNVPQAPKSATQTLLSEMKPIIAETKKQQVAAEIDYKKKLEDAEKALKKKQAYAEKALQKRVDDFMAGEGKKPTTISDWTTHSSSSEKPIGSTPFEKIRSTLTNLFSPKKSAATQPDSSPPSPKGATQTQTPNPGTPPGSRPGSSAEGSPRSSDPDQESEKPKL